MTQVNLGRIGIVPKDAWAAGTYKYLDLVTNAGASYLCKVTTTTAATLDTTAWLKLAQDGAPGASFDPSVVYTKNEINTITGDISSALAAILG